MDGAKGSAAMSMEVLEDAAASKALTIREATEADAQEILEIYAPYVIKTAITFEYEVPALEEFRGRIRRVKEKYPYLVAEQDGVMAGYAYVEAFKGRAAYDWAVETSIYVPMDGRRRGVGRRLYQALEDCMVRQGILNLNACIGYPREEDAYLTRDSVRFHEKLGYRMVGEFHQCGYKFGRWYDMVWMEKIIGEHRDNQPAVRWWPEIAGEF